MEMEDIELCVEIGGIAECSAVYTDGLAREIKATGKRLEDLTLGELVRTHRRYKERFNRIHGLG